ncbi:MAG TPA: response regulator transcription factor [Streptosporangiaceae bacterium]|nr:response regulator transcription factor [Streptosporangiaceae bacterium]
MTPVLLAEHDDAVAEMLARYLARDGLAVRLAASPELALACLADTCEKAVAVVDLTMPGLDPRRVRHALLRQAVRVPVIFLVAPGPRPRGLNGAGARGWLVRPFAPRQLVATVRDLMRAEPGTREQADPAAGQHERNGEHGRNGPLQLDPSRRLAIVRGEEVPLTRTEFAMLAMMLASPGRPKGRGQLLAAAGRTGSDRAADVHIAALRAKIGVPGLIRTVRGAGYALTEPAVPAQPPTVHNQRGGPA